MHKVAAAAFMILICGLFAFKCTIDGIGDLATPTGGYCWENKEVDCSEYSKEIWDIEPLEKPQQLEGARPND